jgi:signal transduction histidine kinase
MRVGQRLMIAVLPAVMGVVTVAALAYWGQYAHQAPEIVVVVAAVAAVGSLVLAWRNTRYVAQRVEHLATRAAGDAGRAHRRLDELDTIEDGVHALHDEVKTAQSERSALESAASRRVEAMAALVEELTAQLAERMSEVQLPLHILLDSPFGELNENQEEMLQSAREAAEAADVRLRQVRKFLELERGAVKMQAKGVGLAEFLRPALAIVEAHARKRAITVRSTVSPSAPRVLVDPVHAQEAVTLALGEVVEHANAGAEIAVEAGESEQGTVVIRVTGVTLDRTSMPVRLADRLIRELGGSFSDGAQELTIGLPAERPRSTSGA